MEKTKDFSKEKYYPLDPIPLTQILEKAPRHKEMKSEIDRLMNSKIYPFQTQLLDGTTRTVCMLSTAFTADETLGLCNVLAPIHSNAPVIEALDDIEAVADFQAEHKILRDHGYLLSDQRQVLENLDSGHYRPLILRSSSRDRYFFIQDRFKQIVIERIHSNNPNPIRVDLGFRTLLLGKENVATHFRLIQDKEMIIDFDFANIKKGMRSGESAKQRVTFPIDILNRRNAQIVGVHTTHQFIPTLIINQTGGSITVNAVNTNPQIEEQARRINTNYLRRGYNITPNDLEFTLTSAYSMSGPAIFGLLDQIFFEKIKSHPRLASNLQDSDSKGAQKMMALQTMLMCHLALDPRFTKGKKPLYKPLQEYPIFKNLLKRVNAI